MTNHETFDKMKKTILFLAMALVSVFAVAQTSNYNQVVWLNGKMMYATPIPTIDSITYIDEAIDQDTLHLLLPRTIVRIQHDTVYRTNTVYKHDTIYINTCKEDTKAIGKFSVSADKQVSFSQGNLQYTQSTHTWSFAANQYDIIGEANITDGALADKIDLFGWSASNTTAPFGISTSTDYSVYYGDFVDWGTNQIGDDAPNTWRTLTIDEWEYLFMHTRWTMAKVNNILGFMLLPNDKNVAGVSVLGDGNMSSNYLNFNESDYAENQYTADQFAQLEAQGCVFLPCAGYRNGSYVLSLVGSHGRYWSATPNDSGDAGGLRFSSTLAYANFWNYRYFGQSVRLVQDLK